MGIFEASTPDYDTRSASLNLVCDSERLLAASAPIVLKKSGAFPSNSDSLSLILAGMEWCHDGRSAGGSPGRRDSRRC